MKTKTVQVSEDDAVELKLALQRMRSNPVVPAGYVEWNPKPEQRDAARDERRLIEALDRIVRQLAVVVLAVVLVGCERRPGDGAFVLKAEAEAPVAAPPAKYYVYAFIGGGWNFYATNYYHRSAYDELVLETTNGPVTIHGHYVMQEIHDLTPPGNVLTNVHIFYNKKGDEL